MLLLVDLRLFVACGVGVLMDVAYASGVGFGRQWRCDDGGWVYCSFGIDIGGDYDGGVDDKGEGGHARRGGVDGKGSGENGGGEEDGTGKRWWCSMGLVILKY